MDNMKLARAELCFNSATWFKLQSDSIKGHRPPTTTGMLARLSGGGLSPSGSAEAPCDGCPCAVRRDAWPVRHFGASLRADPGVCCPGSMRRPSATSG
jgi:hypothetical protein